MPTVTFDDGQVRRNLPYQDYVEVSWPYAEPDIVTAKIGRWVIVLRGHNVGPLFAAFEAQSLKSVAARPELALDRAREVDSYVTEIIFETTAPTVARPERHTKQEQFYLKPGGWEA